ncbi:uncharacterized protein [Macrobrachium rosenbergii]|uniref:uncharacterized protein n=1 Tax=Macrobrachium rosenbergii TaxID=79674 RepID=UPI0034D3AB19
MNCLTSTTSTAEASAIGTSKNALRERSRVESLRRAYLELQAAIPSVPPNTKLSKLDVLMLATTYISHLTQLLQEDDDARKSHDDNNNDTSCTEGAAGGGGDATRESSRAAVQDFSPQKIQQKGLLHPVKKWPMRARLYADVGAAEAGHLLIEPVRVQQHSPFPSRTDRMLAPYQATSFHAGSHLQPRMPTSFHHPTVHVQCKPHPNLVPFSPCGSSYDVSTDHLEEFTRPQDALGKPLARSHFHHGRWNQPECVQRNGGQQFIPAANFPGYANTWHPDMGWDSYLAYNDLSACQAQCHMSQSMNGFSGCWKAWNA